MKSSNQGSKTNLKRKEEPRHNQSVN